MKKFIVKNVTIIIFMVLQVSRITVSVLALNTTHQSE